MEVRILTLTIELTPEEKGRLQTLAQQKGIGLTEYARRLVTGQLPALEDAVHENAASIALLESWLAEAPSDPESIREAEEDLKDFKRHLNRYREEAGARRLYPEPE
jgi:predicted transcriptional regulator